MNKLSTMLCTVFKGTRKNELYLYIDRQAGLDTVPQEVRDTMGTLSEVMTLKLSPDRKLAKADAAVVLRDIRDKGYYLQMPPTEGDLSGVLE